MRVVISVYTKGFALYCLVLCLKMIRFRQVSGFIGTYLIDGTKVDTYRPFDSAGPVNKMPCPPQVCRRRI